MPTRRAVLLGQDVSRYVVGYGTQEQIKSALFKTAEIFMPEFELSLDNTRGFFNPGGARSMLSHSHYNAPLTIYRNGIVSFDGLVKGVTLENGDKTTKIVAGNVISKLADTRAALTGTGVNPALAIYGALVDAGFEAFVDAGSFFAAAGPASDADAVVTLAFAAADGATLLELITEIADICSLTVYSSNNVIRCQAYRTYQGSSAGLRAEIDGTNAREFGSLEFDDSAFSNVVEVNYSASSTLTLEDKVSQARERVVRSTGLDANTGQNVSIADADSAAFFGGQLLLRSAYRRRKLSMTLGPEFDNIEIGHRHPITLSNLGLDAEPMEAVEVRKSLTTDDIGVVFVSLS